MKTPFIRLKIRFLSTLLLLCIFYLNISGQTWVHYLADGYTTEMQMNDLLAVENDLIVSAAFFLAIIPDNATENCINTFAPKLINRPVSWMIQRSNGEIWCFYRSATTSIYRFGGVELQALDTNSITPYPPTIIAAIGLKNGSIIAGTADSGAYLYDGVTWTGIEGSPKVAASIAFKPSLEDKNGSVWGIASTDGLYKYDPPSGNWTHFTTNNSGLTTNYVMSVIDDTSGNIIVATDDIFTPGDTFTSGVFKYNGTTWTKYDTSNTDMVSSDVTCLARDSSGNIWLGSRKGVIRWDGKDKWENMCDISSIYSPCGFIRAIEVDAKNRVWVAGFHWGFFLYDQKQTPCSPIIDLTSPGNATVGKTNTTLLIKWTYQGAVGAVKIEYRLKQEPWNVIDSNRKNTKEFKWVMLNIVPSENYQIRISSIDNPAVFDTSARFTIAESGANIPPELTPLPDTLNVKANQKTTFIIHARDTDKDTVRFSYSPLPAWVSASDSVLTFEPQTTSQPFTLKVTITDGKGGTAQDSMGVAVDLPTGTVYHITANRKPYSLHSTGSGKLDLQFDNTMIPQHVSLYDLCGKKLGEFKQEKNRFTLDCSTIGTGGMVVLLVADVHTETGRSRIITKLMYW